MVRLIFPFIFVCLILSTAFAGTPTPDGLDADVYSITINPDTVTVGSYPEIEGYVQNKSSSTGKTGGNAVFDIKKVLTLPDKTKTAWFWDDVSFSPNQKKTYPLRKDYDISKPGVYQIEFSVYDSSRKNLISTLSKTFTVKEAVVKAPPPITTVKETIETPKAITPPPIVSEKKTVVAQKQKAEIPALPPQKAAISQPSEAPTRRYIGIGGFANTLNFSGGPTLILWPLKNLAIQGSYGWGTFESYEVRGFYRFDLSSRFKPYIGAGYLHAERDFEVTSSGTTVEGTIKGNSYTVFGGVEVSLIKDRLAFYADISGTPLKLEDDVMIGTDKVKVSVDYSPVTIETGLVFYIW